MARSLERGARQRTVGVSTDLRALVVVLGLELFAAECVDEAAKVVSINNSKTLAAGPAVGGISVVASRGGCASASIPVSALSTAGVRHVVFEASVGTA